MQVREVLYRVVIAGDELETCDLCEWLENTHETLLSVSVYSERKREATTKEVESAELLDLDE